MVKGAILNGYLKFIKKRWGKIGLQDAMSYANINKMPKDGEWVPTKKVDKVLERLAENKGTDQVREAGRHAAKEMGIFGYIFGTIVGIERLLKRAKDTYPSLFSEGDMIVEMDDNRAVVTMTQASTSEHSCTAVQGRLIGMLEYTKSNGRVKSLEPDSPHDCKFLLTWG